MIPETRHEHYIDIYVFMYIVYDFLFYNYQRTIVFMAIPLLRYLSTNSRILLDFFYAELESDEVFLYFAGG